MAGDGALPTKPQIERQLVRMLEDDLFRSRPQQAKVLEFLVKRTLADEDVMEKSIREAIFSDGYQEGSTVVRRNVDLLRFSLLEYCEAHLEDALVVIYLPWPKKGKRIKLPAVKHINPNMPLISITRFQRNTLSDASIFGVGS
jgi:hypothetical protein